MFLNKLNIAEKLTETFQCVVLTLNGNQDLTGSHECVNCQQAQAGRAINEYIVNSLLAEFLPSRPINVQSPAETLFTSNEGYQFDFGAGKVDRRRSH